MSRRHSNLRFHAFNKKPEDVPAPQFPSGVLGNLTVANGETVYISDNADKDWNNVTVDLGGTLIFLNSGWSRVGVNGNLVIEGTVRVLNSASGFFGYFSSNLINDDGSNGGVIDYTTVTTYGGSGGTGGTSGPTNGGDGTLPYFTVEGQAGANGDGAGGGTGGTGGGSVRSGGGIYFKIRGNFSGGGDIITSGEDGTAGGAGANGFLGDEFTSGGGGGAGGGGGGGAGAPIVIYLKGADTFTGAYSWSGGAGGTSASGGTGDGTFYGNGGNSAVGGAGSSGPDRVNLTW